MLPKQEVKQSNSSSGGGGEKMSASLKRKTMMQRGGGGGKQSASASAVGFAQFNTSTGNGNGGGSKKKGSTRSPGKGGGRGAPRGRVMDDAFGYDERRPPPSSSNVCHARFFNGELIYVCHLSLSLCYVHVQSNCLSFIPFLGFIDDFDMSDLS